MIISGGKVIAIDKVKTDNSTLAGDGRFDPVRLSDETVTKINTISAKVDGANKKIDTVSSNLSTLSSKVDTISGKVNKNTSDIAALSGEVQTNTKNINTVSGDLYGLSAKTVTQIDTSGPLTAATALLPDGTVKYLLDCSPEIPQTIIHGKDGIYAEHLTTSEWNVGISAKYLSANALNELSGNWQSTYNTVKSNSSNWNTVSAKVNRADFIPVKNDVDVLKANSGHYAVESTNEYITVDSVGKTYRLTFVSGGLATETWVKEQIADFGGFEIATGTGADNHPNVPNPSTKKIYLVYVNTAIGEDKYKEWIYTENNWKCIGETSVDLQPLYDLSGKFVDFQNDFNAWSATADVQPYSGKGIISVKDHIISADSATPIAGSGIAIDWDGNNYTISVSGDYLSANSLADLSGRWESAYSAYSNSSNYWNESYNIVNNSSNYWNSATNIVINSSNYWNSASNIVINSSYYWNSASEAISNSSYYWNSATTIVNNSAEYWNRTYSSFIVFSAETDVDLDEINEQLQDIYDNVMITSGLEYDENGKIAAYMGSAFLGQEYLPGEGIDITNNIISVSGPYAQSGWVEDNFQPKGDYLSANALNNLSGNWESTYKTVNTNSATWEKVKDLHNVEISSTNSSIGITATTAEDGTVKYDLSVDEVAVPDISGENGVSARYDEASNGYVVGLEHSSLTYFEGKKTIKAGDTLTNGIIPFVASDCTLENVTLENGVITIPNKVEKVTFSINETVEGNTTYTSGVADHTYQLNKISLYCGETELLTTQDYYPNEVGFNELTLTYTLDNSKRATKEYSIRYKGTPITEDGEINVTVSIIEEVQSLSEGSGEGGVRYTGRTGNPVIVDNNSNEIYFDGDVDNYTVKTTSTDSNPDYLSNKIAGGGIVGTSVENNQVKVSLLPSLTNGQVIKTVGGQAKWETIPELSGEAPIWVDNNKVGLYYDPEQFTVSSDGLHSTLQIKIVTSGGVIDQEAFEKLADSIYGRMTETIPFGALNTVGDLAGEKQYSYLFRPTIEYDMTSATVAYMNGGNADANEYVSVAVYEGIVGTSHLLWESNYTNIPTTGGQVIMPSRGNTFTGTIKPDQLYYMCVRVDKLNEHGGTWHNVLGLSMGSNTTTDLGNPKPWLGLSNVRTLDFEPTFDFAGGGSMSNFGGTKPYVGFRTQKNNA